MFINSKDLRNKEEKENYKPEFTVLSLIEKATAG